MLKSVWVNKDFQIWLLISVIAAYFRSVFVFQQLKARRLTIKLWFTTGGRLNKKNLTSIGVPIIKTRWPSFLYNEIPYLERPSLYWSEALKRAILWHWMKPSSYIIIVGTGVPVVFVEGYGIYCHRTWRTEPEIFPPTTIITWRPIPTSYHLTTRKCVTRVFICQTGVEVWVVWYTWSHDDVIKWKHFPRYWPFVRGIHRSRWIPRTKASDAELWCLLWSAPELTIE